MSRPDRLRLATVVLLLLAAWICVALAVIDWRMQGPQGESLRHLGCALLLGVCAYRVGQ
jgi:hypothetical protein